QASPLGLASKKETGIHTPRDLVGKKVAIHGDGYEALATALAYASVDPNAVEVVRAEYGNGPLLRDEVDAKQVYYVDEFVKMKVEGHAVNAIVYKDWGHAAYSQVLFVSESTLAKHRPALVTFLQVLDRGWRAAEKYPRAAAALVVAEYEPALDLTYQQESLDLILNELVWAEDPRTGATSPATWQAQVDNLRSAQSLELPDMALWTDFSLVDDAFAASSD
ncbi:MAG: ABC transporter substrate-binding protein, partial [Verrucomicrobiota bacterium]